MVMRAVAGCDPACDAALHRIFGADLSAGAARLEAFLQTLGISPDATDHGIAARRLGARWSTTPWQASAAATSSDGGRASSPNWLPRTIKGRKQ